jgi:hypothetical protein
MIGHHLSISAFSKAARASGVCCSRGKCSRASSAKRVRRVGSASESASVVGAPARNARKHSLTTRVDRPLRFSKLPESTPSARCLTHRAPGGSPGAASAIFASGRDAAGALGPRWNFEYTPECPNCAAVPHRVDKFSPAQADAGTNHTGQTPPCFPAQCRRQAAALTGPQVTRHFIHSRLIITRCAARARQRAEFPIRRYAAGRHIPRDDRRAFLLTFPLLRTAMHPQSQQPYLQQPNLEARGSAAFAFPAESASSTNVQKIAAFMDSPPSSSPSRNATIVRIKCKAPAVRTGRGRSAGLAAMALQFADSALGSQVPSAVLVGSATIAHRPKLNSRRAPFVRSNPQPAIREAEWRHHVAAVPPCMLAGERCVGLKGPSSQQRYMFVAASAARPQDGGGKAPLPASLTSDRQRKPCDIDNSKKRAE